MNDGSPASAPRAGSPVTDPSSPPGSCSCGSPPASRGWPGRAARPGTAPARPTPGSEFPSLLPPAARQVSTADAASTAEDYADLIADLERALFDAERPLPPQTVARIRRALVTIDRAIEDARAALLEVPDDPYLRQHMTNTLRHKSEFLARAAQLAASD